jgi:hypothetical protein
MAGPSPEPNQPRRGPLREVLSEAKTEEKVRGFLALFLVGVLLLLVFKKPPGDAKALAPVIASAQTLAIAVISFYFGLHGATPQGKSPKQREAKEDDTNVGP